LIENSRKFFQQGFQDLEVSLAEFQTKVQNSTQETPNMPKGITSFSPEQKQAVAQNLSKLLDLKNEFLQLHVTHMFHPLDGTTVEQYPDIKNFLYDENNALRLQEYANSLTHFQNELDQLFSVPHGLTPAQTIPWRIIQGYFFPVKSRFNMILSNITNEFTRIEGVLNQKPVGVDVLEQWENLRLRTQQELEGK